MTDQQFMVWTGQAMLWLLIVILAARPVHKYLKFKYLMKFRRHLGWAISIVALAHFSYWVAYLLIYLQPAEIVGYIMAICGIVLVLYPYGSGSDIKHVEREETRRD